MAEIRRIIVVVPSHQPRADSRQLAQFLFDRVEIAKLKNAARRGLRDAGCYDFVFAGAENCLRSFESIEQETICSRADSSNCAQTEPVRITGGIHELLAGIRITFFRSRYCYNKKGLRTTR